MRVKVCDGSREPLQAVSGDCKGRDDEYNRWTTWGAPEVPSKYPVMWKGLTVFLRVISPLYVLTLLSGANCVLDLLWRMLGRTMHLDIVKKVSRKQDLRNPAGMSADKTPV